MAKFIVIEEANDILTQIMSRYSLNAKWIAKIRDLRANDNLLLMYCDMDAGHEGSSGRFESLKETALEYAFLFKLESIKE